MALTVVTPPTATDLTTLANAKEELGIASADTSQDARIGRLITRASSAIEAYCSRRFGLQTVDEAMEWNERARLALSVVPLASITSVKFDGAALAAEDYELEDRDSGMIFLRSSAAAGSLASSEVYVPGITRDARGEEGRHLWVVRYVGGWWLPSMSGSPGTNPLMPADLEAIALDAVRAMHPAAGRDPGIQSERLGDWNATYGPIGTSGLPAGIEARLMRYVRIL
jgi:hypothetical protein